MTTDREQIAGLAKGLAIIEAFESHRSKLSLTRAAETAGLSRAAARRCLRTLVRLGYVEVHQDLFALAPRTLRLAQAYVASNPVPRIAQPIIEGASQRLHHSMTVAVLDDNEVSVIAHTLVHRALAGGMALGTRLPAYCSANGRVLLSERSEKEIRKILERTVLLKRTPHTKTATNEILREVSAARAKGYAVNDQEVELGIRSIAVPIRNRQGGIIASVSISAPAAMSDRRDLIRLLPELEIARRQIAVAL